MAMIRRRLNPDQGGEREFGKNLQQAEAGFAGRRS
jgi:hypothetical protein